jgi:beta-lactam-binding protein with PASTA domain
MTFKERLHWMVRMAMILFVLASVAFLSALTAMRYAVQGREVAIPNLVGESSTAALKQLQMRGVGMKVEDKIYSKLPVDAVVRQSPAADMSVKIGQDVHVVLSLGMQKETIPPLIDSSLRTARIELLRSGLQVGEISTMYLPTAGPDTVVQQDPPSGKSDITSAHVDFLVSQGPRPLAYVMPDLTGLSVGAAEAKLDAAGLKLATLTPTAIPGTPAGTVVSQVPPRGQRIDQTTSVVLRVSE